MKLWPWRRGESESDYPFPNFHADFDEMRRREDPDYDEKRRVQLENFQLRERRNFLRQRVENYELRQEIAALEAWEGA